MVVASRDDAGPDRLGQRRYLTVLFSDLSDSTLLSELMETEYYAEMLNALRGLCREIISKHGGRIARIQGDGVLAIFGYPQAREDDGRRATEAALELHAAVSRLAVRGISDSAGSLALHSGIHGGLVFLVDGDFERGRFEVLGDVPNTAARLSELAERGQIYVSEETLGPETHFFATSERRIVTLKGRSLTLPAYCVLGRASTQSRFQARSMRGLAPFVGRAGEMRVLCDHLLAAIAGVPQCVAISGGPGLGKTRLVEELVHEAISAQCLILRSYCESYLGAEPLQPFLQMLRTICGVFPDMPAAEAAAAAEHSLATIAHVSDVTRSVLMQAMSLAPSDRESRRSTAAETIAALSGLLDALSRDCPLMLIVDDLQWADDASQQMLDAIRGLHRPIFLLLATREISADMLTAAPMPTIELAPLGLDEAAPTIEYLLHGADPFIVAEIHGYAGGNPLFIEELCHSAAAKGDRRPLESRQGGAAWLNALVESRVARLPPAQAEIVRAAAVIGNVIPGWLLERITGHAQDDPLVRALEEQDFLFPSEQAGTLRFKHGITRDVVYNAVGLHQRKAMHLAVATALAERATQSTPEDISEALAYHYAAADVPAEAANYAELAGDKALAAFALDRARVQFSAALKALDRLSLSPREDRLRWCAVAQKLGIACVFDPLALADGVAIFERGVDLARQSGGTGALARAEYWLGYIYYAKGMAREATEHCRAALELSELVGDGRLAAQVRATLGQTLASAGEYDSALVLLDTAIDSKRARAKPGGSIAVGSAYALACKGSVLGDRGLFAEADECFAEALELLGGTVHQVASSVRNWISVIYQWQGRWEEALEMAAGSIRVAEHVKSRQLLAMSRAIWGYANWVITRQPGDLQAVRDATAWIEARKGALVTSLNYGWLVDGAVALDQIDEARRHAARLLMRVRQRDRIGEAMGCRALARAAAKAKDHERADHYLDLAMRSAQMRGSPHERAKTRLCRGEIEVERGNAREALAQLDAASEAFARMRMSWYLQQAAALRSRL